VIRNIHVAVRDPSAKATNVLHTDMFRIKRATTGGRSPTSETAKY